MFNRLDEHYKKLCEKRKIFEELENVRAKDVYAFNMSLPKTFNLKQVEKFLTHEVVVLDGELVDAGIDKPADKGKDLYDSEHTTLCEYGLIGDNVIFSANVEASLNKDLYFPQVCINLNSGLITISTCTCEASDTGTCTHVSCLLHVILDLKKKKKPKIARPCTSKVKIAFTNNELQN